MNIAIDLDGTILEFDMEKWMKFRHDYFGTPKKGAIETIKKLKEKGHRIIIHTCRTNNTHINHEYSIGDLYINVHRILNVHKIPYDEIWVGNGKPLASLYIDDRGFRLTDNWHEVLGLVDKLSEAGWIE